MPGRTKMVINTQERAISTDINRLQSFAGKDNDELLRFMLQGRFGDELQPGQVFYSSGVTAPLSAEVIGGLMVRPTSGSFEVQVDPGVLVSFSPDGAPDESDYKYSRSGGVPAAMLAIGPNVSGSIRIDVIECRVNPIPSVVSDSRDIFDPSTGLFIASLVTKETAAQLEFRVRAGVGGTGYPAAQFGWLPLAVASVPNGAASNDDVTFWDVRPMLQDRDRAAFQQFPLVSVGRPHLLDLDGRTNRVNAGSTLLNGYFRAILAGRVVGGAFRRGSPGAAADSIDIANIANQGAAIAEPLAGTVYVYACTPFALSRWATYAEAPASRIPRSPIGMLIVSSVVPDLFGSPSATIPLPASTGLLGTVSRHEAVCVATIPRNVGDEFSSMFFAGRRGVPRGDDVDFLQVAAAAKTWTFSVTDLVWPPNAKSVEVEWRTNLDIAANSLSHVEMSVAVFSDASLVTPFASMTNSVRVVASTNALASGVDFGEVFHIPIPVTFPAAPVSPRFVKVTMIDTAVVGTGLVATSVGNLAFLAYRF